MSTKRREALIKAYEKKFGIIQKEPFRQYIDIDPTQDKVKKPKKKMWLECIKIFLIFSPPLILIGWILLILFFGPMVILISYALFIVLSLIFLSLPRERRETLELNSLIYRLTNNNK